MNTRIKFLRKHLNLTQQEFADRLGVRRGTIASYEAGSAPSSRTISDICRVFGVDELWLRTGEGEMFRAAPLSDPNASAFLADLMRGDLNAWRIFEKTLNSLLHDDSTDR